VEDPARIVFVRHLMESSKKREQVKNESEVSFPLVFVVEHETDLNLSCLSSYYTSLDSYPDQVRNTARNLFVREPELIVVMFPSQVVNSSLLTSFAPTASLLRLAHNLFLLPSLLLPPLLPLQLNLSNPICPLSSICQPPNRHLPNL